MQPAKVIVFGTPKAGTPLMQKTLPSPCNCRCASSLPKPTGKSSRVQRHARAGVGSKIEFAEVENTLANAEKLIRKTVTE